MSLGFPTDKATVDSFTGTVVYELRERFADVVRIKAWLDTQADLDLKTAGWSDTPNGGEIAILRAAFTDLKALGDVANGQRTQPAASNFFFNASKLTGLR